MDKAAITATEDELSFRAYVALARARIARAVQISPLRSIPRVFDCLDMLESTIQNWISIFQKADGFY